MLAIPSAVGIQAPPWVAAVSTTETKEGEKHGLPFTELRSIYFNGKTVSNGLMNLTGVKVKHQLYQKTSGPHKHD